MKYTFVSEREDYTPYANGLVFHSLGGHPPLPVRLASEVFLRACYALTRNRPPRPIRLYDPLCGSGITLATLKLLHGDKISAVAGSDADPRSLEVAALNFALLTREGMQRRIEKLRADLAAFGKESHREALAAAEFLLDRTGVPVEAHLFQADATQSAEVQAGMGQRRADIAVLDIPYGDVAAWQGEASPLNSAEATRKVLLALAEVMAPSGLTALFMPKRHRIDPAPFERAARIGAGKREVWLLRHPPR